MSVKKLRITINAPVILGFASGCVIATLLGLISGGTITRLFFATYREPLTSPLMYLRLFTHVLGHNDLGHLMGNMAYILLLGPILEEKYGQTKVIEIILVTAFVTGLINNLLFGSIMLCGASGVVFAFILLTSFTGFQEGEIPLTFILVAVIYLGQQIWEGLTVKDNVSNLSHILGGTVGAGFGYVLNRRGRE